MSNIDNILSAARCEDRSQLFYARGFEAEHFVRVFAPYALAPLPPKYSPLALIVINRQRSPLGVDCEDCVPYSPFWRRVIRFERDPATESNIWWPEYPFLYDRSPADCADYTERLRRLASLARCPVQARAMLGFPDLLAEGEFA